MAAVECPARRGGRYAERLAVYDARHADLSKIHYLDIHADTWGYGFSLWLGGVGFNYAPAVSDVCPQAGPAAGCRGDDHGHGPGQRQGRDVWNHAATIVSDTDTQIVVTSPAGGRRHGGRDGGHGRRHLGHLGWPISSPMWRADGDRLARRRARWRAAPR